ncbi:MAG: insulinase family protein [Deltaproteobacteria bacterium]|nr:insulinase family protein [Deltaproteobacteria bacterium]
MLKVTTETLPNGLQVLYLRLPHVHAASLSFMTRAGPRYESEETNGLSHVMEHLLFRGTEAHPDSLSFHTAVEELGGEINGLTQRDAVTVHMTVPPRNLSKAVRLLAEVCTEPLMTGLAVERNVILEEIMDTQDADGRELDIDTLSRQALWDGHPMAMSVTGPVENVKRFKESQARAHFKKTFTAANSVLVIAGPLDREALSSVVRRAFRALPRGQRQPELAPPTPPRWAPLHIRPTEEAQVSVVLSFPAPHENHPEFGTLLLVKRLLDDGFGARLRQAICEQRGLAYSLAVSVDAYRDCGALDLELSCAPQKLVPAVTEMWSVLAELCATPVPAAELRRAKNRHVADLEFALDDPSELCGWYGASALVGAPVSYEERHADLMATGPERVMRLCRAMFGREHALLTLVGPVEPPQAARLARIMGRSPGSTVWLDPADGAEEDEAPLSAVG